MFITVKFEILMVANMKIIVSWDVVLWSVGTTLVTISQTTGHHIPEGHNSHSLLFSQGITAGPYPEPVESNPCHQTVFL
jgi:hypothetical protein